MRRSYFAYATMVIALIGLATTVAQAGLAAWWKLDETSGSTAFDSAGTHDAAYSGNPTPVAGQVDGALAFDGSGDYVTAPGTNQVDLDGKSFSIGFWAKRGSTDERFVIGQGDNGSARGSLHIGFRDADTFTFAFWSDDLNYDNAGVIGNTTDWHHWTTVYDADAKRQTIYLDGQPVAGRTTNGDFVSTGSDNFWIGRRRDGKDYNGAVDDVVVYDQPLAANQVAHIAAGGNVNNLPAAPIIYESDFWDGSGSLEGWTVLKGVAHLRSGDGGGVTPGKADGSRAHDDPHETFLLESAPFRIDAATTLDGTSALIVQFAGGAGDQNNQGQIFNTPAEIIGHDGGNGAGESYDTGQKGLAFLNVATGQYDAVIFEDNNNGVDTRKFSADDLIALGVDLSQTYRLHYYENDHGGWGWGQLNFVQIATVPEPATIALGALALSGLASYVRRRRT